MTTMNHLLDGAPSACEIDWDLICWDKVEKQVRRLQVRIAKAVREGRHGKAKALQWILSHSSSAKLIAVRRVTQNKGSKTAGVDNVIWTTPKQKMQAVEDIKQRGYQPLPLRRIYIPKKNGKLRPLSIPTMADRAQQALHLLTLEPISETLADKNAYGFRPKRSCADAIEQCFKVLCRNCSAQWVLEGDIKSCFDKISHPWLMDNIPMDKSILEKWLKAGYIEKTAFNPTFEGTPQGWIISPTLLVLTLTGLEQAVKAATGSKDKVNIIVYADDFINTGASREILESKVKPAVISFLKLRGLTLSEEKTHLTHVNDGFNFLGFNVRKYDGKLLIKPAKENVKLFLDKLRNTIKNSGSATTEALIRQLNPKIRGWSNYYRHVVSKRTFSKLDHNIFCMLWQWTKRRHPNKSAQWRKQKYYRHLALRDWLFFAKTHDKDGFTNHLDLAEAAKVKIRRHLKIKGSANPYELAYDDYFDNRSGMNKGRHIAIVRDERCQSTF
jgi:RNA-directed DNA polymerase